MVENGFNQNPEWQKFKGRENRYPNQFGGIGDNGDGVDSSFNHVNGNGEALIIPGVNCTEDEAASLEARGAIFPLEIAQPDRTIFVTEADFFPRPIRNGDI